MAEQAVQTALTAIMTLRDPVNGAKELQSILGQGGDRVREMLRELGFVHFARFVMFRSERELHFGIITTFDFDLKDYMQVFIDQLGQVFDKMLPLMKPVVLADGSVIDPAELPPVRRNRMQFMKYVDAVNATHLLFEPAYPHLTVQNILTLDNKVPALKPKAAAAPRPFRSPQLSPLDLRDIQGIIVRGYHMDYLQHFILKVKNANAARRFIQEMTLSGRITTAEEWERDSATGKVKKPASCLNLAFTIEGLKALGVDSAELEKDPTLEAFVEGAVKRAQVIGDVEASAPENWIGGKTAWESAHVLLSLHASRADVLEEETVALRSLWAPGFEEVVRVPRGSTLGPGSRVIHFGYVDGIAQPVIAGVPHRHQDDENQRPVDSEAGAFLLGYPSQWQDYNYPFEFAAQLLKNGSFAAFRIIRQDVAGFEEFLTREAALTKLPVETIAAKICGRWRDGKPLVLAPTGNETIADYDNFGYAADPDGHSCPFGAHIRRTNPRDDRVAAKVGSDVSNRRIIRRGMPYGPKYNPDKPDDQPRGLFGLFICANLQDQFEFIMKNWVNRGGFHGQVGTDYKDPLVGPNTGGGRFSIPGKDGNIPLDLSQFVMTQGAAYCFLPSITGLKYIAGMRSPDAQLFASSL